MGRAKKVSNRRDNLLKTWLQKDVETKILAVYLVKKSLIFNDYKTFEWSNLKEPVLRKNPLYLFIRGVVILLPYLQDPNAPKRPQTAFFLFAADHRAEAKKTLPEGNSVFFFMSSVRKLF